MFTLFAGKESGLKINLLVNNVRAEKLTILLETINNIYNVIKTIPSSYTS
jgi:hypothetical protein